MLKRLILMVLMLMPLAILEASAISKYNLLVEENGEAAVIIEIEGSGLTNIPIQADISNLKVKGALYRQENSSLELSIASTEKAVILYKTSMLTSKIGENWTLNMDLGQASDVTLALPKHAIITGSSPNAFIDSEGYNKLVFQNASTIQVNYVFGAKNDKNIVPYVIGGVGTAAIIASGAYFLSKKKKPVKETAKVKILKTLSENERIVVQAIMEKGEMKRSDLEKITKLAKSSLANTLNNLEKKNIIELDKTYTTHFVKFTGWFDEL